MALEKESIEILRKALERLESGFQDLPPCTTEYDARKTDEVLMEVADRMRDNYPYHHPLYAGQMIKPPHPVARAAYMLSMWINPNNHALDGGKASSAMEKEAVAQLASMIGYEKHLGHLTSGGTMANLEALWIGGKLHPDKLVLASDQAHYTHSRLSDVLGLRFKSVPTNDGMRMDLDALERILKQNDVGMVVATIGTTGAGCLDPLAGIMDLRDRYGFRIHADAAYGGYFKLAGNLSAEGRKVFERLQEADSLVIDPHKHGLQPYGCGCIMFRDPSVGRFYKHDSPYTYFTSSDLHLGEISLECSRPGAAAVGLWATQRLLPMVPGGEFAHGLESGRAATLDIFERLKGDGRFRTVIPPELDIVLFAPDGPSAGVISDRSERFFDAAERNGLYLAKFRMDSKKLASIWTDVDFDQDTVTLLRSCLMKPEHLAWTDKIWNILDSSVSGIC